MKRINKFALFILGALSFASCSDINDIESEGYRITGEQIDDATSVIPSRVEAKICLLYTSSFFRIYFFRDINAYSTLA